MLDMFNVILNRLLALSAKIVFFCQETPLDRLTYCFQYVNFAFLQYCKM